MQKADFAEAADNTRMEEALHFERGIRSHIFIASQSKTNYIEIQH